MRVEWIGAWCPRPLVLDSDGMGGRRGCKKKAGWGFVGVEWI